MLFTDSFFLFYFLPFALLLIFAVGRVTKGFGNVSKAALFALTLVFYSCQEIWWLIPFLICVVFDFVWASLLVRLQKPHLRRAILALSISGNLSLLALFKYWTFFRQNLTLLSPALGPYLPELLMDGQAILLPAGISFYTFESLSFVIDVYRREITPPKNPLDFAAFIAMFPRFVAGPIVRYKDLRTQFTTYNGMHLEKGLFLFAWGMALKVLLADNFAVFAKYAFENDGTAGFLAAWIGVLSYSLQIYFDFSGYSLMAIGLGWCLGFEFPANFDRPYLATSLQDFWRRWHITLSRWLRDYLYIPLGGNRKGAWRTHFNVFLTMTLGGLWHGASWTFVLWGVWHGGWLVLEKHLPARYAESRARTFLLVVLGWVFFRAKDFSQVALISKALFNPFTGLGNFNPAGVSAHPLSGIFCIVGILYCFVWEKHLHYDLPEVTSIGSVFRRAAMGGVFTLSLVWNFSTFTIPFLYFQF